MHDVGVVVAPILVILFAAYWNNKRIDRLEDKIDAVGTRVDTKIDAIGPRVDAKIDSLQSEMQQEFREFYKTLAQQDARIDHLERSQTK